MGRNYVVLRRSPDWLTFDLEDTRVFCRSLGLREDLILDYAERWDAISALDYLSYRQAMKDFALSMAHAVRDATVISHQALASTIFADDDLLFFTDDDDWTHPDLFRHLRAGGVTEDGWMWRSVFVGRLFGDTPYEKQDGPVVQERPSSDVVYTNNYAVTGRAWRRLGEDDLLEHYHAQRALDQGRFAPSRLSPYLSAANKHICCTVCINFNMRSPGFAANLRAGLAAYVAELEAARPGPNSAWLAEPLAALAAINRRALVHD